MGMIKINQSYISNNGNLVRLNTYIEHDGSPFTLYAEVEEKWSEWLTPELADNIVILCLPVALRTGLDIMSVIPVSNMLLHNLNKILIPTLTNSDDRLIKINISAPGSDVVFGGNGVGTGLSCGVDSLYAAMEYTNGIDWIPQLTHFCVTSASLDLWNTPNQNLYKWQESHRNFFNRCEATAYELGIPCIKIYSNYFDYCCCRFHNIPHYTAHQYITLANVLSLKKLWGIYLFASGVPFTEFNLKDNSLRDTIYHELLIDHSLTIPGLLCLTSGADVNRIEKTISLTQYPLAKKYLHPCFTPEIKNCTKPTCHKCLRALLTLHQNNELESFSDLFDIERFKTNFNQYILELIKNRTNIFLSSLYEKYKESHPKNILETYELYVNELSYIKCTSEHAYSLASNFLDFDNLNSLIMQYFHHYNIDDIFFIGDSKIGNQLYKILRNYSRLSKYSSNSKGDVLIMFDTEEHKIKNCLLSVETNNFKDILSLSDLYLKLLEFKNSNSYRDPNSIHSILCLIRYKVKNKINYFYNKVKQFLYKLQILKLMKIAKISK